MAVLFFDASPLFDAVANDLDGDPGNEVQGLSRSGNNLILTQPDGNNNTVSLADLVGTDSGIISQFEVVGQNLVLTEDATDFIVPLSDFGGGREPYRRTSRCSPLTQHQDPYLIHTGNYRKPNRLKPLGWPWPVVRTIKI